MPDANPELLDEGSGAILQLKVRLLDVSPMVWRRVVVPTAMTLKELHGVFQVVLGWRSLHLYRFRIHAVHYGSWELGAEDPERALCSFNFRRGDKFVYEYDMTDDWKHEVRIEAWLEPQPRKLCPACIGGRGDCPPEECGGPAGYDESRIEALGLDAQEDIDTIVEILDRVVLQDQPDLLNDDEIRRRLEDVVERNRVREPFWPGRFDRRQVNTRLRAGEHRVLKHQQLC